MHLGIFILVCAVAVSAIAWALISDYKNKTLIKQLDFYKELDKKSQSIIEQYKIEAEAEIIKKQQLDEYDKLLNWDDTGETADDIAIMEMWLEELFKDLGGSLHDKPDDSLIKAIEKQESIQKRFAEIEKIREEQSSIIRALEGPSKGAAFSRFRNGAYSEVKKLEQECIDIMQSIVDDDFDPLLTVDEGGEICKIKMSELIIKLQTALDGEQSAIKTKNEKTDLKKPRTNLKLIEGGKNEQSD